ncbi:MAG: FGGY-family carbohydrate kinase [Actinobacteria bacterium]|nr:FGGY-family carbohydrate kinase [Actinomycetota bacterium]
MNGLLLGVDIGTATSKGTLARPDGSVCATAERPHGVSRPHPGWVEQDADGVWWEDFCDLCRELVPKADDDIAGVCCSGLGPCVVAADVNGHPLRPAILYGVDTRAATEIQELTVLLGAEEILARCGSPLTSQAVGPKLAWLRANEPEVWDRTMYVFMASSYLVYRLTGEYILDHHSASQSDPLYELAANEWIEDWASEVAPGLRLPRLLWPGEIAGSVSRLAADTTGLAPGTPVAAGTIDTWAEAASVGVRNAGDMMLMYGTTMFLVEVLSQARPDHRLWSTVSLFAGTHNLAGGMAASGALTSWFKDVVGLSYETLIQEAAESSSGSNGLVVLPYFAGERAPLFDTRARGVICGLNLGHTRGDLYRALLEGTAFGVQHILEVMSEAGGTGRRIVAVGGGTKGGLWTEIVSNVIEMPQDLPEVGIGASYGDAFLAAVATGLAEPGDEWNSVAHRVEPNSEHRDVYDELYATYRELYPATREHLHALADMQGGRYVTK